MSGYEKPTAEYFDFRVEEIMLDIDTKISGIEGGNVDGQPDNF